VALSQEGQQITSYAVCALTFYSKQLVFASNTQTLNAGDSTVEAACPSNYSVISGGWERQYFDSTAIEIDGSHYGTKHEKWVINAYADRNGYQLTAYAVCAQGSYAHHRHGRLTGETLKGAASYPLYEYVSNTGTIYPPSGNVIASCPKHYYAVGGGFEAPYQIGAYQTASLFGSDYQSWAGATTTIRAVSLTAYAVCGI
jgi:hypothetical protein